MSYYDKNYYPTPRAVIDLMLEPFKEQIKTMNVLEPSAGMGAIADAIKWQQSGNAKRIYCCEIDETMKATLTGKGYKVIQGDFLQYSGSMNFDLIVMNPPFDRGAEHLLKAWEILRDGDIVCLLNSETINNPHTQARRELMDIIEKNGSVEHLGPAFDNADRKTGVQVALVRLKKEGKFSELHFNLKATEAPDITKLNFESQSGELERADYIGAMIRTYDSAVAATALLHKAMTDFRMFTSVFAGEYGPAKMCNQFFETSQKQLKGTKHGYSEAHNEFVMELQKAAWNKIFDTTAVAGMMTDKVRQKFNKWREEMGGADLNRENIGMLFEALIQQRGVIGEECILEAFDRITEYSEKNRQNFKEAYKTNSAYMVGSKFILNYVVESGWSNGLSVSYNSRQKLDDIDRALCMVSGKRFEDLVKPSSGAPAEHLYQTRPKAVSTTTYESISAWCMDRTQPEESEFFKFKCYLKGSAHFTFKDEKLRMEFNRIACSKKGWQLPEEEKFAGKNRRDKK